MTDQTLSRKEREREFRRQEILTAAVELFAEKGFQHTTLDDIAEAAEFGKGTIYNYFQNKEDIYLAILESIFTGFHEVVKSIAANTTTAKDFLCELTKSMFNYCLTNRSSFYLLVHTRILSKENIEKSEKLHDALAEIDKIHMSKISNAIKTGELKKINPESLIRLYRGAVFSYIHNLIGCHKEQDFNVNEEIEFITSTLLNGILSSKN